SRSGGLRPPLPSLRSGNGVRRSAEVGVRVWRDCHPALAPPLSSRAQRRDLLSLHRNRPRLLRCHPARSVGICCPCTETGHGSSAVIPREASGSAVPAPKPATAK